jgi:hypothetical protein
MPAATPEPRRSARAAGGLYLLIIAAGIFAELVVRNRLIVPGDAARTAANILASEQLYRWAFAAEVFACLCVIPLILLLYELFKIVSKRVALLAVFFSLVGTAVQSAALIGHFAPLLLLAPGPELGIPADSLQVASYFALRLQSAGYAVALAFFGGTMLARGYLILRCLFLPRIIGVLLAFEGVSYLANSFVHFVAPGAAPLVFKVLMVSGVGELVLCLWLIVAGVNDARWRAQAVAAAG